MSYYESRKHVEDLALFVNSLKHRYDRTIKDLINAYPYHLLYMVTISPKNPYTYYSLGFLNDQIGTILNSMQKHLFRTNNLTRPPLYLRPILILFQDIPGTKGDGKDARKILLQTENERYQNRHFHGILLIPKEKLNNWIASRYRSYLDLDFQILPFDPALGDPENPYGSKAVKVTNWIDESFGLAHVWHSSTRCMMTPEQLREHFNLSK